MSGHVLSRESRGRRLSAGVGVGAAVVAGLLVGPSITGATAPQQVIRVEEDWQLVLNAPSQVAEAPQLHTVMSPGSNTDGAFAQVTWNYREYPDFESGGMQIQGWSGNQLAIQRSFGNDRLSTNAETITWTQVMETDGTHLAFAINNGSSTTWGTFGYPAQNMHVQGSVNLDNLNSYSPSFSASNSGVTFGSNRVASLVITQVREYREDGTVSVDTTPRVVFELN